MTPRLRTDTSGLRPIFRRRRVPVLVEQEVEAPHLVRAVVRAVARAHAAVVDHVVQALVAVDRRRHRAHHLAGRVLAVLAHHRLVIRLGRFRRAPCSRCRCGASASRAPWPPAPCPPPARCSRTGTPPRTRCSRRTRSGRPPCPTRSPCTRAPGTCVSVFGGSGSIACAKPRVRAVLLERARADDRAAVHVVMQLRARQRRRPARARQRRAAGRPLGRGRAQRRTR